MDTVTIQLSDVIASASVFLAFVSFLIAARAYWLARAAHEFVRLQNLPTGYATDGYGGDGWTGLRVHVENPGTVAWHIVGAKMSSPRSGAIANFWKVARNTDSGRWTLDPPKPGQASRSIEVDLLVKPGERNHIELVSPDASLRLARELRISLTMRSVSTPRRQLKIEIAMLRPEKPNETTKQI